MLAHEIGAENLAIADPELVYAIGDRGCHPNACTIENDTPKLRSPEINSEFVRKVATTKLRHIADFICHPNAGTIVGDKERFEEPVSTEYDAVTCSYLYHGVPEEIRGPDIGTIKGESNRT